MDDLSQYIVIYPSTCWVWDASRRRALQILMGRVYEKNTSKGSIPMKMSKANFIIWIVIVVVTFFLVTVGRRLLGFEVGSSFISTVGSLVVLGVALGSFYVLKKKE